ncbi:endoplasmic reticulum-Golgi intermediate compartment protein 2 [Coprinopsis cinerea okayama7|uniref:Endoplasmic reticulum-Golgi intermediate compartment protein 2 n=1 Tax=Coprinopsis cinerea (strain Okayama-7 / 130 / ATCC MYA-4618 / FGSC 9003) TaxID=240176 RepID=A8NVE2_COPC7|nr:endoplasmic reticulum-Golgi intermediate compartment protein 2 [Coprinopsis cinerea okayama7\|eukprot:XP_001836668.1 endoplasmic reticulum-Golgi intermediate compartment protein 2 [Coprinopsis cinerea okayama7\
MGGLALFLAKLEDAIPASLTKFDAFPKLPSTYKARSESRGFLMVFVIILAFLLMLNDIGEFIWGWPDFEFGVDNDKGSTLPINLDMTVNMPCKYLTVDLRDAMGDRLFLSNGFRRDGTIFDVGQATALKEHAAALSAQEAVAQSRKSRGFFATLFRSKKSKFKPTYNHQADASACRIWGTMYVKKVTANLHVTTLGHGYASYEHVDHHLMNLSHVIQEFSFGPHFPEIVQPLDNSFEATHEHFIAYQYFLHVVPTTYVAPRTAPLETNQYSVTHYTRVLEHNRGTPGIFFKFELDPLKITQYQRTTTLLQLMIRCVGVIGGVFVCTSYALRIGTRAVEVVSGADQKAGIVAAESTAVKVGLRAKWGGSDLRARPGAVNRSLSSGSWTPSSPYGGFPATTPVTGTYSAMPSPYLSSNHAIPSQPGTPNPATPGYPVPPTPGGIRTAASMGPPPRTPSSAYPASPYLATGGPTDGGASVPPTPGYQYATFPTSPHPTNGNGLHPPPPPRKNTGGPKDD